jgi:hypothetical protein
VGPTSLGEEVRHYCRFLLLHLTEPTRALQEMRDLLKPGGILVCETAI